MDEEPVAPRISGDLPFPLDASPGAPPALASPRSNGRLSRRTLLRAAGVLGVGVGAGVVSRAVYLLTRNQTFLTYRGHDSWIEAIAWSPDSQWIASTSGSDVQVWEALTGRLIHRFPDPAFQDEDEVARVAWSPDGNSLATGSWEPIVTVWDVATGKRMLTYRGHEPGQRAARFSEFDLGPLRDQTMDRPASTAPPPGIESLAWSPDGTRLLSSGRDWTTQVWEAVTGKTLLTLGSLGDFYEDGAWLPNGQHILMRTPRGVQIHDATTGAQLLTFAIGDDGLDGPASVSPDGKWLAARVYSPEQHGPVHLWEVTTGRHVLTYEGHSDLVISFAWAPNSKHLASSGLDLKVQVWDEALGQTEYTYWGHLNPFQQFFSEPLLLGSVAAASPDHSASTMRSEPLHTSASVLVPQDTGPAPAQVTALAWAPNGRFLASGGSDTTVQVWQPE